MKVPDKVIILYLLPVLFFSSTQNIF